jgi:predicted kinase
MKRLVVFAGPPCSGKSTAGRLLRYPHLEMDAVRARLMPDSAHTRADRAIAYRAMLWMAELLLAREPVVIVNGGFGRAEDRTLCLEAALRTAAELRFVEFHVPLAVALERNRSRRGHHPGLDLDDARVTDLVQNYPWTGTGLTVDGTKDPKVIASGIRWYIEEGLPLSSVYE